MSRIFRGKNGIFRNPLSNTTDAAPSVLRYPCATPPLLRGADRRARKSRKPLDRLVADNYNAVIGLAFANLHVWERFPAGPAMRGGVKAVQLLRSGENYLKTILILQKQNAAVRSIEQQRPRSVHTFFRAQCKEKRSGDAPHRAAGAVVILCTFPLPAAPCAPTACCTCSIGS